jgi:ankyrin repeat protein
MIDMLITQEKTKAIQLKDMNGWTPMHWACRLRKRKL